MITNFKIAHKVKDRYGSDLQYTLILNGDGIGVYKHTGNSEVGTFISKEVGKDCYWVNGIGYVTMRELIKSAGIDTKTLRKYITAIDYGVMDTYQPISYKSISYEWFLIGKYTGRVLRTEVDTEKYTKEEHERVINFAGKDYLGVVNITPVTQYIKFSDEFIRDLHTGTFGKESTLNDYGYNTVYKKEYDLYHNIFDRAEDSIKDDLFVPVYNCPSYVINKNGVVKIPAVKRKGDFVNSQDRIISSRHDAYNGSHYDLITKFKDEKSTNTPVRRKYNKEKLTVLSFVSHIVENKL